MDTIKYFDKHTFDALLSKAEQSERRRANLNVHGSYEDVVQRLFIAMMPDSYVRPHRHVQAHKWEFFMVLEGELTLIFFDDDSSVTKRVVLNANGDCKGIEIPPNVWHATVCEAPVVFMEVKQGPYEVTGDKGFAEWAPCEGSLDVPAFLQRLKVVNVGQRAATTINQHDVQ